MTRSTWNASTCILLYSVLLKHAMFGHGHIVHFTAQPLSICQIKFFNLESRLAAWKWASRGHLTDDVNEGGAGGWGSKKRRGVTRREWNAIPDCLPASTLFLSLVAPPPSPANLSICLSFPSSVSASLVFCLRKRGVERIRRENLFVWGGGVMGWELGGRRRCGG